MKWERYWELAQLGKIRSEVIQIQFFQKIRNIILVAVLGYFAIFLYYVIIPEIVPTIPSDIDFLAPISTIFGMVMTFTSIATGFSNYFVQKRTNPEIITIIGENTVKGMKTLVTFCNIGKTSILRNYSLFAVKEKKSLFKPTIPEGVIETSVPIFHGWQIIKDGGFVGISEEEIKSALIEIDRRLEGNNDLEELEICLVAFDEEFDICKRETEATTLIAGCKLGEYSELIDYAKGKREEFPTYNKIIEICPKDVERLKANKIFQALIIRDCPPNIVDVDFEILAKLESIEESLKKMGKND